MYMYMYMYVYVYVYIYIYRCIFFLSLSLALKESFAASCNTLKFTKAAITPDSLATTLLQTGCGRTHVQPRCTRGVAVRSVFCTARARNSSVIGAPQRMQYLQTGVQRVFLMTRLAEFTGLICSYGVRSWPDRTFVSLAEEISNEKRESQRHQACRLDRRRSGFALRDLM